MKQQPIRTLLIEDNIADAEVVREMLEETVRPRFEMEVVHKLEPALRILEEHRFDVILVDLNLPDSRGLGTFLAVQKSHPGYPVILLTGLEDEQLAEQALKEGAQDLFNQGPNRCKAAGSIHPLCHRAQLYRAGKCPALPRTRNGKPHQR
jgi:DNA-binding NtrC family response regulator